MTILDGLDPKLDFEHPVPKAGAKVWTRICQDNKLPRRQDLDPASMPAKLLPHIVLIDIENDPGRRYRWRLLGTHFTTVLGRDSTGKYVDDVLPEDKYHEFVLPFTWVIEKRRPLRIWGNTGHAGKDWLQFESFLAPLVDDDNNVNMLFSAAMYGK